MAGAIGQVARIVGTVGLLKERERRGRGGGEGGVNWCSLGKQCLVQKI